MTAFNTQGTTMAAEADYNAKRKIVASRKISRGLAIGNASIMHHHITCMTGGYTKCLLR